MNKLLPNSEEAERAVAAGIMLLGVKGLERALKAGLEPCAIYSEPIRRILKAALKLASQSKPIDLLTTKAVLAENGELEKVGVQFLADLTSGIPTALNIEAYAEEIVKTYRERLLITRLDNALDAAWNKRDSLVTALADLQSVMSNGNLGRSAPQFKYIELAPAFLAVQDPPIKYLVSELIPEGVIVMPHGEPRTMKTWGVQELCIAIATGTPPFGMERFRTEGPVPVLYSSQEDSEALVRMRFKAILKARGITSWPETLAFSVHKGIDLESQAWQDALLRDVERYGFKLMALDPVRRYSRNADRGPSEMQPTTEFLRRLTVETGVSICGCHHDIKPGRDGHDDRRRSHRASGGDWFASAECPIAFERSGERSTLVIPEDYKVSTDPEPFSFRLETDDPRTPTWAKLIGETSSASESKILAFQEKILGFLFEHPAGASGTAIAKAIRVRKEDVLAALNKLLQSGEVDSYGGGGPRKKTTWFLAKKDEE